MSLLLVVPSRTHTGPAAPVIARERAPDRLRRFVGGRRDDAVVLSREASELIALVSPYASDDVVVLAADDEWPGARTIEPTGAIDDVIARLDAELTARPASLVVVTAVSGITGEVLPVGRFASAAHRHGARILVVADHLVAHRAVSIASWGIDYIRFSSRELDSRFAFHVLVGRSDRVGSAPVRSAPGSVGAAAVAASAEALVAFGFEELGYREQALRHRLDRGLARLPGVGRVRVFDDALDVAGAYGIVVDGRRADAVVDDLSVRHGVGVCRAVAHPLDDQAGVIRVSTDLGTSTDDVDRLLSALASQTG